MPLGTWRRCFSARFGKGHRITGDRTKNHNRGIGWDAVHLAIDDHSRVAFAKLKPDEGAQSCAEFLREAVAFYAGLGVQVQRVMTDNGTGYKRVFEAACAAAGVRHVRTRPYTPQTNGKVERLVQTSLREWAYVRPTGPQLRARRPCSPSSTTTTGIGHTQLSITSRP